MQERFLQRVQRIALLLVDGFEVLSFFMEGIALPDNTNLFRWLGIAM